MAAFKTYILYCYNFDVCSYCSKSFNFCYDCWSCVNRGKEPKFGISNKIPKLYCQYYPTFLENLISAKKTVIVKAYPVIIILKFKLNNSFNLRIYRSVCRYFVLLLQNLGPLLTLLPLETTSIDDIMQVV